MALNIVAAAVESGDYVSAVKAVPVLIIVLIWARLLTWADKDSETARLPRTILNIGLIVGLIAGFGLFIALPNFWVALAVLIVLLLVEAAVYLFLRNQQVGLKDLGDEFKNWLRSLSGKEKEVKEIVGAVQLVGPSGGLLPAPEAESPEAEAYNGVQRLLTDALENNAERILIEPAGDGTAVKYMVDGVIYSGANVPKAVGASSIGYLKVAAGLDFSEHRKPQTGTLKLNINSQRRELSMTTSGSTAGEKAQFITDPKHRHDWTLETMGMWPDQIETIRTIIREPGIFLLGAPKGQGLTSLSYAMLRAHDAFLEHIMTLERDQEQDLEGITQNKIAPNAGSAEETKQVSWLVSQQPDVLLVSKPESPQSAAELIKAARDGRRIYVSFVAGNTAETLNAWRKLVGDDKLAMSQLKLVIAGRTVRKLCVACKQGYMPDPDTLRKLNISSKVEQLFQARKETLRDPKGNPVRCEFCNDLRFKGRTGIYEVLVVDDEVTQVILAGGTPAQLKTAFRKQKGRYLQESGLALVEQGETSVQEVLRVLKSDAAAPGRPKTSGPSVPAPA